MKTSTATNLLDMAESTLRKYAVDYASYLSPTATRGAGTHRDYSDQDVRILKLINDMKRAKQSDDDISVTLSSLQAGEWARLPELDEGANAIIQTPGAMVVAQAERAALHKEIEMLREQIADLKTQQQHNEELVRRLAEAELMIKLYESGRLTPPKSVE